MQGVVGGCSNKKTIYGDQRIMGIFWNYTI